MRVWAARFLLPITGPPVRDGAVAVEGDRIVAAGARQQVLDATGDPVEVRDLGNVALIPGLVNTHLHLELSWMADDPPTGGDFVDWVRALLARREREEPDVAQSAAERAIREVVARGTVAVGDVGNGSWIVPLLARSNLHGIAFHEIYGFRGEDGEATLERAIERLERLAADADCIAAADRLRVALAPHGPHTTSGRLLRAIGGRAAAAGDPLSVHVAESRAESDLLMHGTGPFADLLRERGAWDDGWNAPHLSPVAYLDRLGLLSARTIAVHCAELDHQDRSLLQARRATVVTCPRSNERLGLGPAPVPVLLAEGIPVALGTDSLASVPDLDPFAELAALCRIHPALAPAAALRVATLNGARALGLADRLGSIEPGKLARLLVVALPEGTTDPLEILCAAPARVFWLEDAPWEPAAG